MSAPAQALTAPELWQDWSQALSDMGQEVTVASQSYEDGVLRLVGVRHGAPAAEGNGYAVTLIDALVLSEKSGGVVGIEPVGRYRVEFGAGEGRDKSTGALSVAFNGLEADARGTPGAITYDLAAQAAFVTLERLVEGGAPVPANFNVQISNLASRTSQSGDAYDSTGSMDALALAWGGEDQDGAPFTAELGLGQVVFTTSGSYGEIAGTGVTDPMAIFRSQTPAVFDLRHGPLRFELEAEGDISLISARASTGALTSRFGKGRALYGADIADLSLGVDGPGLAAPLQVKADKLGYRIDGPMLAAPGGQPFAARITAQKVTMPQAFLAEVDPGGRLPRDPASLTLEMEGQVRLTQDLVEGPITRGGVAPGEILALKLDQFALSALGAEATANGQFTAQQGTPPVLPVLPGGVGRLQLEMQGVGQLLSDLMAVGLLDMGSAMIAQMALGNIAVPAPSGGDKLISDIELGPGGSVTVNGRRLR